MFDFNSYFNKISKKVPTLQIYIESPKNDFLYRYSNTYLNQPFHSASVGKVFCATLIMMAIDEGFITLNTKITTILDSNFLCDLFVFKGTDYQNDVTVEMLLSHTSGINDYFEGKTFDKSNFLNNVFKDKDHLYTPEELLNFTRKHQKAVGKPSQKFLYSDSGYILLGFILEKIYNKPYYIVLREKINKPLKLKDTALCFYDDKFKQESLAPLYFNHEDLSQANSLSCDYSGGGLQTTTEDLAIFLKGLFQGKLISKSSLAVMMKTKHRFHGIMRYGLGLIEIKFYKLVPWKIHYPTLYGGLGSLSVHAFYNPKDDEVFIINLGDVSKMRLSFMILTKIVTVLRRLKKS